MVSHVRFAFSNPTVLRGHSFDSMAAVRIDMYTKKL
jgi:hypothetical protein